VPTFASDLSNEPTFRGFSKWSTTYTCEEGEGAEDDARVRGDDRSEGTLNANHEPFALGSANTAKFHETGGCVTRTFLW
jgi:hypothetical protein